MEPTGSRLRAGRSPSHRHQRPTKSLRRKGDAGDRPPRTAAPRSVATDYRRRWLVARHLRDHGSPAPGSAGTSCCTASEPGLRIRDPLPDTGLRHLPAAGVRRERGLARTRRSRRGPASLDPAPRATTFRPGAGTQVDTPAAAEQRRPRIVPTDRRDLVRVPAAVPEQRPCSSATTGS